MLALSLTCLTAAVFVSLAAWRDAARVRRELVEARSLARVDGLTGALNRAGFDEALAREIARARRNRRPLAVAYVDLDRFKALNDGRGHAAGDAALVAVVAALREALRETDAIGRLGGDEFAVVLPEASFEDTGRLAARLADAIRRVTAAAGVPVTASIGVAHCDGAWPEAAAVLGTADRSMYDAKRGGRDAGRIVRIREAGAA